MQQYIDTKDRNEKKKDKPFELKVLSKQTHSQKWTLNNRKQELFI